MEKKKILLFLSAFLATHVQDFDTLSILSLNLLTTRGKKVFKSLFFLTSPIVWKGMRTLTRVFMKKKFLFLRYNMSSTVDIGTSYMWNSMIITICKWKYKQFHLQMSHTSIHEWDIEHQGFFCLYCDLWCISDWFMGYDISKSNSPSLRHKGIPCTWCTSHRFYFCNQICDTLMHVFHLPSPGDGWPHSISELHLAVVSTFDVGECSHPHCHLQLLLGPE